MDPILTREPLLVRACSAIVDNLRLILEIAFIAGAFFLVQDFRGFSVPQSVAEIEPGVVDPAPEAIEAIPETPVVNERIRHFFDCTYEDYRVEHYAECVDAESEVYQGPLADPDDTSHLRGESAVLLARLDPAN